MLRAVVAVTFSSLFACSAPLFPTCPTVELSVSPNTFDAGTIATVDLTFASAVFDLDGGTGEVSTANLHLLWPAADGGSTEETFGSVHHPATVAARADAGSSTDPDFLYVGELLSAEVLRVQLPRRITATAGTVTIDAWKRPPVDATLTPRLPGPVKVPPENCVGFGSTTLEVR